MNRMTGERCVYSCAVRTHTTMPKDELRTQGTLNELIHAHASMQRVCFFAAYLLTYSYSYSLKGGLSFLLPSSRVPGHT